MGFTCRLLPALRGSTARSFREVNRRQSTLPPWFAAAVPVVVWRERPTRDQWRELYAADPEFPTMAAFSRAGFSHDYQQALVYVETFCDGACGGGRFLLFGRDGGAWVLTSELPTWVG
jgi:hypothetical protein